MLITNHSRCGRDHVVCGICNLAFISNTNGAYDRKPNNLQKYRKRCDEGYVSI